MNYQTVQCGRIPLLLRRGGCGINKKSRSHRSAADGVVAHTQMFQNRIPKRHSRATTPSAPVRNGTIFFGAATPPLQGGECARLNSFTASVPPLQKRGWYQSFWYRPLED